MRVYYLDKSLSDEDMAFTADCLGISEPSEQIRIPHVLPSDLTTFGEKTFRRHQALLGAALRNAGIARDCGRQITLVAPRHLYCYAVLANAVYSETGAFPWLVQTKENRDAIGNPGETRVLDTHGLMGEKWYIAAG